MSNHTATLAEQHIKAFQECASSDYVSRINCDDVVTADSELDSSGEIWFADDSIIRWDADTAWTTIS